MYLLLVVALQEVRATELTRPEEEKVTEEHQERPLENAGQRHPGSLQRVAWGWEKERPLGNAGQRHQGLCREWPGGGEGPLGNTGQRHPGSLQRKEWPGVGDWPSGDKPLFTTQDSRTVLDGF